jgi:biopolymer transport protein ExbD
MKAKAEPNVVPLCDVLLVLLIIFMVITPSIQRGLDVRLPETTTDASAAPANVIVMTLHKDYRVDINQRYINFDQVQEELNNIFSTREEKTIFLRAEAKTPLGKVIELIDKAKGVGVEVLALVPELFEEK